MNIIQIFTEYYQYFLRGTRTTILISLITVFCGAILGCIVALMRISNCKPLQAFSKLYITVIRGTPMLVQLYIVYYQLSFIQYPSGTIWGVDMERAIPCVIALSLNSAAYLSETLRGGIMAVDYGQREAALALGVSNPSVMLDIVMPQALKSTLPGLVNEMINLLKNTSLVSCISLVDLLRAAQMIISKSYRAFEPLLTVAIIYYILVGILAIISRRVERWVNISDRR